MEGLLKRERRDATGSGNERHATGVFKKMLSVYSTFSCLYRPSIYPSSVSDLLPLQPLSPKSPPPSLLVSGKLITLLTLLDFLWTVHLALFLKAALPLIHCLFASWQWKGKQQWVLLTGGDEESATLGNVASGLFTAWGSLRLKSNKAHCRNTIKRLTLHLTDVI